MRIREHVRIRCVCVCKGGMCVCVKGVCVCVCVKGACVCACKGCVCVKGACVCACKGCVCKVAGVFLSVCVLRWNVFVCKGAYTCVYV